jgi:hypothetical protein
MTEFGIHFGALCPPVSEQLRGLAAPDELAWLDKYANAVTLLAVHSLLSEREAHQARKRIMKRAAEMMRDFAKQKATVSKSAGRRKQP